MKKLIFIIGIVFSVLLTGSTSVNAMITTTVIFQKETDEIPRKSKVIKVSSLKSASELFEEVILLAKENGLSISKNDKEYLYFMTECTIKNRGHRMYVTILETEKGSLAVFKSEWRDYGNPMFGTEPSWCEGGYKTGNRLDKEAFLVTYKVAKKIENGTMEFEY